MTSSCTKCKKVKLLSCFPIRNTGKPNSWCKECHNRHSKQIRECNLEERNAKAQSLRKIKREELRQAVFDYLSNKSCIACGESDRVVFEFDHRVPEEKNFTISEGISRVYSKETLFEEIEKCDILCANCHRRKTVKQFGWNK